MKRFVLYWVPVIFYSGFIFYLSSISSISAGVGFTLNDKLLHTVEYAILAFLLYRAGRWKDLQGVITFFLTVLYGISDEIHQYFVPGRVFDVYDILFNAFGAALVVLIVEWLSFRKK